jgi:hypothetical protein
MMLICPGYARTDIRLNWQKGYPEHTLVGFDLDDDYEGCEMDLDVISA